MPGWWAYPQRTGAERVSEPRVLGNSEASLLKCPSTLCAGLQNLSTSLLVRHRAAGAVAGLLVLARPKDPAVGQVVQKDQQELARVLPEYQEGNLAVAEGLKGLLLKGLLLGGC